MAPKLTVASHASPGKYYEGGRYQLNMTFEVLRDKQWQRAIEQIWTHPAVFGPIAGRFYPGGEVPAQVPAEVPPPTAMLTQHGQMQIDGTVIGIDVEATRSLFECLSVSIPVAMFADLTPSYTMRQQFPALAALDDILFDIALKIYDLVPFKIAAVGYERECQLLDELMTNGQVRHAFLVAGNFLAQEDALSAIEPDLSRYEQVRPNLRGTGPLSLA